MKPSIIGLFCSIALAMSGCETLNGPQAVANAEAQRDECKVVALTSGTQIMRGQNPRDVDRQDIRQAEGSLELGHLQLHEPRALHKNVSPHDSTAARMARAC
ncbi:MAG TPA: hypothetical protein VHL33_07695 [Casimicrobiaceae bacterium]|jgi:hypothetical protein|nr:hypothetical protein [Casimicrobiaceae bacterium]